MYYKSKFKLNYSSIEELCKKYEKENDKLHIEIQRSPNKYSNSYYLRFKLNNVVTSLRISDHDTLLTSQGGGIRNLVVHKNTKVKTVMNMFEKTLSTLDYKREFRNVEHLYKKITF